MDVVGTHGPVNDACPVFARKLSDASGNSCKYELMFTIAGIIGTVVGKNGYGISGYVYNGELYPGILYELVLFLSNAEMLLLYISNAELYKRILLT